VGSGSSLRQPGVRKRCLHGTVRARRDEVHEGHPAGDVHDERPVGCADDVRGRLRGHELRRRLRAGGSPMQWPSAADVHHGRLLGKQRVAVPLRMQRGNVHGRVRAGRDAVRPQQQRSGHVQREQSVGCCGSVQ